MFKKQSKDRIVKFCRYECNTFYIEMRRWFTVRSLCIIHTYKCVHGLKLKNKPESFYDLFLDKIFTNEKIFSFSRIQ